MFFKIRYFLPINVLICLYNSLFSPFMQYGILVWGLTYDTYINPVFLLQKRVVKAISFQNLSSPSTPIFSGLKILKLHDIFQLKLLCFVYYCVNKISPTCFHSYHTRQATNKDIFLNQKNALQYGLRSVRYFGAKCWKNIPLKIKSSKFACSFRCKLKTFFFENKYCS